MSEVERRPERESLSRHERDLKKQLYQTSGNNPPSQCESGVLHEASEGKNRRDHGEVQKRGRCGGRREVPQRVEYSHASGHEADEEDVRKGDSRQFNGNFQFAGIVGETGSDEMHQGGRESQSQGRHSHQKQSLQGEYGPGRLHGGGLALPGQGFREYGNKSHREGAFGKKTT